MLFSYLNSVRILGSFYLICRKISFCVNHCLFRIVFLRFIVSYLIMSCFIYLVFNFDSCLIIGRIVFNLSYYLCIFIFFLLSLLFYFWALLLFGPMPAAQAHFKPNSGLPSFQQQQASPASTRMAQLLISLPHACNATTFRRFTLPKIVSSKHLVARLWVSRDNNGLYEEANSFLV